MPARTEFANDEWEILATNLRVEKALLPILDRLSDLRVVVFKGGTLTREIYGDLRKRVSGDNDIWLRPAECRIALERLLELDHQPAPGIDPRAALRRYGKVTLWPGGDLDAVALDLHAEPYMGELFRFEPQLLEGHLVPLNLHGYDVFTFDRPLAFAHLVAHFLQHRLEREHLPTIGVAWERWKLDEKQLRAIARKSCTEAALEHSVWLCSELGWTSVAALPLTTRRARLFKILNPASAGEPLPTRGRILSILLAAPHRFFFTGLKGVVLEPDDLLSRYGDGSRIRLTVRRAIDLLRRG